MAGDDLDGIGDHLGGALEELLGIVGLAQGMGANDADVFRRKALQALGEQGQASQAARHGLLAQALMLIQAVGQMDALL